MDGDEDPLDEQDLAWDEEGHSTRAFEAWTMSRDDILIFFDLTHGWSTVEYKRLRRAAEVSAAETYGDVPAEFDRLAKGLWPTTYEEILCASGYVMLVAYFEVYLEDALQEVGEQLGFRMEPDGRKDGPDFSSLAKVFRRIGLEVETTEVKRIRELRHWVAHRRASIETAGTPGEVDLEKWRDRRDRRVSIDQVRADAGVLHDVIRAVDPTMWRARWLGEPSENLRAIVDALHEQDAR